jgi:uncharacterized BrkB/YihY/UPF0761 family membrane protein
MRRLRDAYAAVRRRLDALGASSRVAAVTLDALGEQRHAGGPVLPAALAFRIVLFFAPFVALYVIIVGYIADWLDRDPHDLIRGEGVAALTANGVEASRDISNGVRFTALVLVAYALVHTARSFVKMLRIVHALAWREPPTPLRHGIRAGLVFIGIMTGATMLSTAIVSLHRRLIIGGLVALVLYTLVPFIVWVVISSWLPHGTRDRLGLLPGAVMFAFGVEILHFVTVVWFPHEMESKSALYGALGGALVLLLWAYLLGRLITYAASLNAAIERRRTFEPPDAPPLIGSVPLIGPWSRRVWSWLLDRNTGRPAQNAG